MVFEVEESRVKEARAAIERLMSGAAALDVPLTVDIRAGKNWGGSED